MPSRILYAGQSVTITTNGGLVRHLPVQSANCDTTNPIEDILSFGHLGSLGRYQTQASSCKSDIKSYLPDTTGSQDYLLNTAFIQGLTGEAISGLASTIVVTPNGFTMSGILASLGVEIQNGGFATADLSFVGIGQPIYASAPNSASFSEQGSMPTSFTPITSSNIAGQAASGCASSFKFNLDMPNETISCLGGIVSGSQGAIASSYLQVSKPPFKTNISVEGLAVDLPNVPSTQYAIGKLGIILPNAIVESRAWNQSVGAAGASWSYNISDITVNFQDLP